MYTLYKARGYNCVYIKKVVNIWSKKQIGDYPKKKRKVI